MRLSILSLRSGLRGLRGFGDLAIILLQFQIVTRNVTFLALRIDTHGPPLLVTLLVGQVHDLVLRDGQLVPVLRVKIVQNRNLSETLNVNDLSGLGDLSNGLGLLLVKGRPIVSSCSLGLIYSLRGRSIVPSGPIVLDGSRGLSLRLIKTVSTNLK